MHAAAMDRSDFLPAARLQELAHAIDPKLRLEPEAEQVRRSPRARRSGSHLSWARWQVLQDVADDFVENVAAFACELAAHRSGKTLEARDIQMALGVPSPCASTRAVIAIHLSCCCRLC